MIAALGSLGVWLLEKLLGLTGLFRRTLPAQRAVNTESRMATDVADAPDQAKAVSELDDGDA